MKGRQAPRYQGKIKSWKDEQGFGFIAPNGGGTEVFVHIKSFDQRGTRPAENDIVTYHLGVNARGQPRAEQVALVRGGAKAPSTRRGGRYALMAAVFLGLVGALVLAGRLPFFILGSYLGLSVLTFLVYAADKSAARHNRRRTPENTLHLLAVLGGWPGAVLAQQVLRHKSSKQDFRAVFGVTVFLNCAALAWLLSPFSEHLLR